MKRIFYVVLILSLFLSACSETPVKVLSKEEIQTKMQQSIKDLDNLSSETENSTTVIYNKFTTKFDQKTSARSNMFDSFALDVKANSNNTKYPVKSYSAYLADDRLQLDPAPVYINFRAKQADRKFIEETASAIFNLTRITQNVVKPSVEKLKLSEHKISYSGTDDWMKTLFDYGLNASAINQIEAFQDLADMKVESGSYEIDYSDKKIYPKQLTFNIKLSATINGDPATIMMKQTTKYSDFNKTKVEPFKE